MHLLGVQHRSRRPRLHHAAPHAIGQRDLCTAGREGPEDSGRRCNLLKATQLTSGRSLCAQAWQGSRCSSLGLVLFSMHSVHCWPCNHWRVLGLCCQEFNSETWATPSAFAQEALMAPVGRRCGPRGYLGRVVGESGKGWRWFLLDNVCRLVPWEVTWQGQHARPG